MAVINKIAIKNDAGSYVQYYFGCDANKIAISNEFDNVQNQIEDIDKKVEQALASDSAVVNGIVPIEPGAGLKQNEQGLISIDFGSGENQAIEGNDSRLNRQFLNIGTEIGDSISYNGAVGGELTLAPTYHASSDTRYGIGNATNFGHVKLTNSCADATSISQYGASAGIAASAYGSQQAIKGLCLEKTLTAGQTSLTFTNSGIRTGDLVNIYTSIFTAHPTDIVAVAGSVTVTFKAQQSDVQVRLYIERV